MCNKGLIKGEIKSNDRRGRVINARASVHIRDAKNTPLRQFSDVISNLCPLIIS